MNTAVHARLHSSPALLQQTGFIVLCGGLAIAAFDAVFCLTFWGARGVAPMTVYQSIAAGLLGPAAYQGGAATALLGAALQLLIGTMITLTYVLASHRLPALLDYPIRYGLAFGLSVYLVMEMIVLPLSAVSPTRFNLAWELSTIVFDGVVVGLTAAMFARWVAHVRD